MNDIRKVSSFTLFHFIINSDIILNSNNIYFNSKTKYKIFIKKHCWTMINILHCSIEYISFYWIQHHGRVTLTTSTAPLLSTMIALTKSVVAIAMSLTRIYSYGRIEAASLSRILQLLQGKELTIKLSIISYIDKKIVCFYLGRLTITFFCQT